MQAETTIEIISRLSENIRALKRIKARGDEVVDIDVAISIADVAAQLANELYRKQTVITELRTEISEILDRHITDLKRKLTIGGECK